MKACTSRFHAHLKSSLPFSIAPAGQHSLDSFAQFILDLRILSRQIFSGNWRSSNILLCIFLYHIAYTFLLVYVLLFHLTSYNFSVSIITGAAVVLLTYCCHNPLLYFW